MAALDPILPIFALANLLAASSGAIFRPGPWYERIRKPPWRPPNWLFGPVWFVLYCMIAVSGWMVWRAAPPDQVSFPIALYGIQLLLNACWSYCFFGLRRPGLALLEMSLLWIAIAATMAAFVSISELAALLLVPYLLWVSFAWVLNHAIWRLNKNGPGQVSTP